MKIVIKILALGLLLISCKTPSGKELISGEELTIAFGSCNKQYVENLLWKEVLKNTPYLWIWGGDNIYSDTDNKEKMGHDYQQQLGQPEYQNLLKHIKVMGTWDDHDYGLNDGGAEFTFKKESEQLFLDFMEVPAKDERREREGVYYSEDIVTVQGTVKVLILDTRYFRSALTKAVDPDKRYQPNNYGEGTILGEKQWQWLDEELSTSKADFNIIVSSIQVLSNEHGFETWGNFPHEVDKLLSLIQISKAKGVLLLSGDRHFSEFSKISLKGLDYPLIDFTSSGLTHVTSEIQGEPNKFREGYIVPELSFGVLRINFKKRTITMQMRGVGNKMLQELIQHY